MRGEAQGCRVLSTGRTEGEAKGSSTSCSVHPGPGWEQRPGAEAAGAQLKGQVCPFCASPVPELQLLTAQGAGAAPPGLQPVHLAKSGHNVLDTSDCQFTGNKRDLFPVKHPSLPRIHN